MNHVADLPVNPVLSRQAVSRREAIRIKAVVVLVALASWLSALAIGLLVLLRVQPVSVTMAVLALVAWLACLPMSWSLYCPWCCKPLFFVARMSNSPSWEQLFQQCVPHEILARGRFSCPHCRSRFALPTG